MASTVVVIEIFAELSKAGRKSTELNKFVIFSTRWLPGSNLPFVTSADLLVALIIIHRNGNMEINAATLRNI